VQGCSNKEIASQLKISPRTVKQHLRTNVLTGRNHRLNTTEQVIKKITCATPLTSSEYGAGWSWRFMWPASVAGNGKTI
jgi:hypothetical protein